MVRTLFFITLIAILLSSCSGRRGANENVEVTWGLDVINAVASASDNVALPILKCKFTGFVEDVSEYRAWAAKRKEDNGTITATVPSAGTYYPAFIFYDGAGDERIAISIDGRRLGTAVANMDDNRQKLFFLTEAQTFKGGETIELKALTKTGQYKTEDLLLLRTKPQAKKPDYLISEVGAAATEKSATITWLTNWPSIGTVETDDAKLRLTEALALNNHRVVLTNLEAGKTYRYRIATKTREGETVVSDWGSFRTVTPPEGVGSARKERLELKLEPGELPVTVGVPFPKGTLGSDAHLRLTGAGGAELSLQSKVLQRWPDSSLKWVLLDFTAKQPSVSLEYGAEVNRAKTPSTLQITDSSEVVTVDTGRLKFTLNKRRFGLFDEVWRDGSKIVEKPSEFTLTNSDGTAYSSLAAPEQVVVEESGPVRATIRVTGHFQAAGGGKLFRYVLRIHAWASQPYVRIQHTFENDNTNIDFTEVQSLSLRVPLMGTGKQWSIAGVSGQFSDGGAATLKQHTDDQYVIEGKGGQGKRANGVAEWSDGSRTITLAVRDFWQNYPKDLSVTPGGFELALMPPLKTNEYESAKGTIDEHRIYYYLQNGKYKLRQGVTKTHDIWFEFGGRTTGSIRTEQQVRMAAASPDWYEKSQVFGEISVPRPSKILKWYDDAFTQTFAGYLRDRDVSREYGMLNFGDWWGERIINWGNSEYDTQHAFLLQFARTGDWRYFRAAEQMEWHNRDIDAVHHHADPLTKGAVYGHAIGHTGDYYTERPTGGAPAGGFTAGSPKSHFAADHTFIEGHFDYYFLTGDRRSYDTALSTADRYDSYFTRNYDFNNCRQPGWHLIMTLAAYRATNDAYYLNAAKMIVERVLERQTPDGGWKRQMVPGHCFCTPRHQGNAGFMVGVLLTGMRHYYDITKDERVAKSIVKGAQFLVNDMWVPGVKGFHYTSCPKSSSGAWSNFLLFDGIVFAHQRTGDAKLREVLLAGTEGALRTMTEAGKRDGAAWGKGFTQYSRVVPHFLEHLAGLKDGPAPKRRD